MSDSGAILDARLSKGLKVLEGFFFKFFFDSSDFTFIFYRIVRAFLIEEQKIVVRVLKAQQGKKTSSD